MNHINNIDDPSIVWYPEPSRKAKIRMAKYDRWETSPLKKAFSEKRKENHIHNLSEGFKDKPTDKNSIMEDLVGHTNAGLFKRVSNANRLRRIAGRYNLCKKLLLKVTPARFENIVSEFIDDEAKRAMYEKDQYIKKDYYWRKRHTLRTSFYKEIIAGKGYKEISEEKIRKEAERQAK